MTDLKWEAFEWAHLQSPELADECDTSDVPPQVNHRTHSARGDMSPLKQRLPSSKRARKRRHSSNLSNKFPREEPDYQMHIAPSCCHGSEHFDVNLCRLLTILFGASTCYLAFAFHHCDYSATTCMRWISSSAQLPLTIGKQYPSTSWSYMLWLWGNSQQSSWNQTWWSIPMLSSPEPRARPTMPMPIPTASTHTH